MIRILIVDDEVHIRTLLEQTLEDLEDDFELEIFTAPNGKEALALIQAEKPDLVFLDVMMPVMNGFDVCVAVRAAVDTADIPIVMLTAKGQENDRQRGFAAGASHFMTKPFNPDEVVVLARSILAGAKP